MKRSFKTEIKLNDLQTIKFKQSVGVCRWLYNSYIYKNKELYQEFLDGKINKENSFMTANDFDKYINNEIKIQEDFSWINSCGSKARKKSIVNAEIGFKRFFKSQSKFPRFKKKRNRDIKLYYPKNNVTDWLIERHRVKIPLFGWVILKEKGYLPSNEKVISGTLSEKAGRYYVSILFDIKEDIVDIDVELSDGIGIDLGLKDFAICSSGEVYKNINKSIKVRKLEKKLKREQRKLSRKYDNLNKNKRTGEGESATRQNIQKQVLIVQKVHHELSCIRQDYIQKISNNLIKRKPSFIVIEDLNIRGMMKNRHLSKAISKQNFYEFRLLLEYKCAWNGIELRIVNKFYPSSKLCSSCGFKKTDLKLSDRIYDCKNCGELLDRDLNASLNLKNAKEYKIA